MLWRSLLHSIFKSSDLKWIYRSYLMSCLYKPKRMTTLQNAPTGTSNMSCKQWHIATHNISSENVSIKTCLFTWMKLNTCTENNQVIWRNIDLQSGIDIFSHSLTHASHLWRNQDSHCFLRVSESVMHGCRDQLHLIKWKCQGTFME